MLPVPVRATVNPHVEPDENDFRGAKMHGEIDCLKPAVAPAADTPEFGDNPIARRVAIDVAQPVSCRLFFRPRELRASEFRNAATMLPPGPVAPVERVRPGR